MSICFYLMGKIWNRNAIGYLECPLTSCWKGGCGNYMVVVSKQENISGVTGDPKGLVCKKRKFKKNIIK